MLNRAAGTEQGARNLLERRQRRVALQRFRERRGARVADMVVPQAAARRGGSGMLVAEQGRRQRAGRARLTRATSASRCFPVPPRAPRRPPRRCCCSPGLSEETRVRDARGETLLAQTRTRATYMTDVSVALTLSASESAAAPWSPIWLPSTLQQKKEGQGCSRRDIIGTEQGARNLLERRQRRTALERLRERSDARLANVVFPQAAAKRGGSGMLVAKHYWHRRRARAT
jgi:hypothetical protein